MSSVRTKYLKKKKSCDLELITFPQYPVLTKLVFLYYLNSKLDLVISNINFNSKCHEKWKFTTNFIQLVNIFNLFTLKYYTSVRTVRE